MNLRKPLFGILFFTIAVASAQVKIGDNPNSIDPASLVELQSTDKAFVLTRVTDTESSSSQTDVVRHCYQKHGTCFRTRESSLQR